MIPKIDILMELVLGFNVFSFSIYIYLGKPLPWITQKHTFIAFNTNNHPAEILKPKH